VKPNLLVVTDLPSWSLEGLSYGYTVHHAPDTAAREALLAESGLENFRAFLTNGSVGMAGLPITDMTSLELICVSGAGYDQVDLAAAQAQGIAVTNGPSTNETIAARHPKSRIPTTLTSRTSPQIVNSFCSPVRVDRKPAIWSMIQS
jgi:lactate dehydrogenase-like 2-hydroxyacid dehydrogenase